ncbi:SIR2 family protein [Peribacillus castrilensis]|uniref:SIR2 family protein n=1 Tax=Peribacillus TaxID=2675229 RepID=UPI0038710067
MATPKEFKREFLKALDEGNAAIFAGAGLSKSSGFVNWSELLQNIAEDIGLDVSKEHDLVALAQYYYNEKGQNRSAITRQIIEEFTKETDYNENLRILTSLPIKTYWTTNYDKLIENSLDDIRRKPDVKITESNLAQNTPGRDAVVYKMHGDVGTPENAVIIKDDYEAYNFERQLFSTNLQGDLISKTFLFIGFSFEDPNLSYILSRIRVLLGSNKRDHYCFFKKVQRENYSNDEDFLYDQVKQKLKINDLQRYSINAVLVNGYDEITMILQQIENSHKLNNIFISGSAVEYGGFTKKAAQTFIYSLAKQLVTDNYKITSGFGEGVGDLVINGSLTGVFGSRYKKVNDLLVLKPFPQFVQDGENKEKLWTQYREDIINDVGIVIFMFGNIENSTEKKSIEYAAGMMEEFEIAKRFNKLVIPIGSTGYVAKEIFDEITKEIDKYGYLKDSLSVLEKEKDTTLLIREIKKIIKKIRDTV